MSYGSLPPNPPKYSSGKYRLYKLQAIFNITVVNLISKKLYKCNIYLNHSNCWT